MRGATLMTLAYLVGCISSAAGSTLDAVQSEATLAAFAAWEPPVNLGPVVDTNSVDGCPYVSKDNLTLYFASNRPGGHGGLDLYVSHRASDADPWGPAVNLESVNSSADDFCPTLSTDEHSLYLVSTRSGGCGGQDLYVTHRADKSDDQGWDLPVNLGCTINSPQNDFTPSLIEDEMTGEMLLYFSSNRPGGMGGVDIWVSSLDPANGWSAAANVAELNTAQDDQRPNIRHDGKEIFFSSNRPGSAGLDLYSASRDENAGRFANVVRLPINSAATDDRPSISWDGDDLYFMSNRSGGSGSMDLWVSHRAKAHGPTH
ncbi:MAG TPA: hypothetical protein VG454_05165 [Gemmatimonadales bacterium]|nr:hypothetical protein [Gemmatimonadales bacterium]